MKKVLIVATVLALCSLNFAQTLTLPRGRRQVNPQQVAAAVAQQGAARSGSISPFSSADCAFTFTSGSKNTFLKYCVTANGNITVFETPQGSEHIAVGKDGEGYGICDAFTNVAYDDYAEFGDTGNWNPAVVLSHSSKSVKIARTTSDGIWTLTQTISQMTGALPSAKIVMTLKNNSTVDRQAAILRYADIDADGDNDNNFDSTQNSAFAWNSLGPEPFGVVLENIGTPPAIYEGFTQFVPDGPPPCDLGKNFAAGVQTETDGSIVMVYLVDLPKGASRTVTVAYKGL